MTQNNSLADLFAQIGTVPEPSKSSKGQVAPMPVDQVAKIVPELTQGLLQSNGQPWDGAFALHDDAGEFGPAGAVYVVRAFVRVSPALAQFVLTNYGAANRDMIKSTQDRYIKAMSHGEWGYVGNTAVFTVGKEGQIVSIGQEQHNMAHTMRAVLVTGKTVLGTFIFGIPKSQRDKIDDNQQRTAKDIVTTRSEMKQMFAVNGVIGNTVPITKSLSATMMKSVSEAFRIVKDIRDGRDAKSGGSRDKSETGRELDLYCVPLGNAVAQVVALDSRLDTKVTNKEGVVKDKAGTGLTKRAAVNHLAGILTLAAAYHKADGTLGWDENVAVNILRCFMLLGNEKIDDISQPMVSLRHAIDRWNAVKQHKGSEGMNIRFNALKIALLLQLQDKRITDQTMWEKVTVQSGRTFRLGGLGSNPDAIDGIVGIDDYVDPTEKAMETTDAPKADGTLQSAIPEEDV